MIAYEHELPAISELKCKLSSVLYVWEYSVGSYIWVKRESMIAQFFMVHVLFRSYIAQV